MARTCGFRIPSRIGQPLPQQPATGAGDAGVEERKQGRATIATQGVGNFEIAARGGVERQIVAFAFDGQGADVRQCRLVRRLSVADERTRGANTERTVVDAVGRKIERS